MACFLVPAAEAVVVGIAKKKVEHTEEKKQTSEYKIPFSRKLKWLNALILGGAVLLLFEHIWHGEIVPWFPFLTAMSDAGDTSEMLHEMATVGVSMAVFVTFVWGIICIAADAIIKRSVAKEQND